MAGSRQDITIDGITFTDVTESEETTTSLWKQSARSPLTYFGNLPRDVARFVITPMLKRQNPFDPKQLLPLMQGIPQEPNDPAYQEIQSAFGWTQAKVLLQYVVCGDQAAAETIIKANPALLLERATVTDYSGRRIEGTPLQLALGAEDFGHQPGEECMVEMIAKYMSKLPDGDIEIAKQTREQFPEGWEEKEAERQARDRAALHAVINTIAEPASDNDEEQIESIRKAIQTFQAYLAYENNHLIKTGKHFNHLLLGEALDLFSQNFDTFGGYDSAKNNAVWREVIGSIQRMVPAATAQALCTGVGNIVDRREPIKRGLMFFHYDTNKLIPYFPLDVDLGRRYAVYSLYAALGWACVTRDTASRLGGAESSLKNLFRAKDQTCKTYLDAAQTRTTSPSVSSLLR